MILHWLGTMFDPALSGYWGSDDVDAATETFLELIAAHAGKVDGVKVSLLDADHEIALRRAPARPGPALHRRRLQLPGADRGDGTHHSDALLGIFAAIDPAASTRAAGLDAGDAITGARRSWTPPRSSAGTSFPGARPTTTRPASPSWPG